MNEEIRARARYSRAAAALLKPASFPVAPPTPDHPATSVGLPEKILPPRLAGANDLIRDGTVVDIGTPLGALDEIVLDDLIRRIPTWITFVIVDGEDKVGFVVLKPRLRPLVVYWPSHWVLQHISELRRRAGILRPELR